MWGQRYPPRGADMAPRWAPTDDFPYRVLRWAGVILIALGLLMVLVDISDVVYTLVKYTSNCDNADYAPREPCNNAILKWTWISSGIWGGLVSILAGLFGWRISTVDEGSLRTNRDIYGVLVILFALAFGPAVIVLQVMKIIEGIDIFYGSSTTGFDPYDLVKFILPVVTTSIAAVAWVTSIVTAMYICCCAHFVEVGEDYDYGRPYFGDSYPSRPRRRGFNSYDDRDFYRSTRPRPIDYTRGYGEENMGYSYLPTPRISPYRSQVYGYNTMPLALPATGYVDDSPYMMASPITLPPPGPLYASPYAPYNYGSSWVA